MGALGEAASPLKQRDPKDGVTLRTAALQRGVTLGAVTSSDTTLGIHHHPWDSITM